MSTQTTTLVAYGNGQQVAQIPTRSIRPIMELDQVWKFAGDIHLSGMAGGATHAQIFTLMMICESEGIDYIQAIRRYDVIEGKPALKAAAMLAEFQARGGHVEWHEFNDDVASATWSHPVTHPKPIMITITYDDCLARGLPTGKDGLKKNWRVHRGSMLSARCITRAVRLIYPGIAVGIYSPEEIEDMTSAADATFENLPAAKMIDITPKPSTQAPSPDVPVIGQRTQGHDPRPYHKMVDEGVSEANANIADAARAAQRKWGEEPIDKNKMHGEVLVAAMRDKGISEPPTRKNPDVLKHIVDNIYTAHRDWTRTTLDAILRTKVEKAKAEMVAKPAEAEVEPVAAAESESREPGSEG
jgi:hypothetical protein